MDKTEHVQIVIEDKDFLLTGDFETIVQEGTSLDFSISGDTLLGRGVKRVTLKVILEQSTEPIKPRHVAKTCCH
jgi:hypothetical protein